jgi:hypothetical protein
MIHTRRLFSALAGLCLALALTAISAAAPAPLSATTLDCPNCISRNVCADIESSGSTGCSVTSEKGCQEDLGLCICGDCESRVAARGGEHSILYATPYGKTALAYVGENRFATWNCKGQLAFLVERAPDGKITELPVMRFRNTYSLRRVLESTAAQAE